MPASDSNFIRGITRPASCRQRGLCAFAFTLLLLGLCIFAWGLRYKLSLYSPPHSFGRHMPAAKLLSGQEQTKVRAVSPELLPVPPVFLAFGLMLLLLMGERPHQNSSDWHGIRGGSLPLQQRSRGAPAAIRPPPIL